MNGRAAIVLVASFGLINLGLWLGVWAAGLERQPVDLQSRLLYEQRLHELTEARGKEKIVFLGDSVVYGGNLARTLGRGWSNQTLPAHFARLVEARRPGRYAVVNLGIDGVLPRDLYRIVLDVLPAQPRLLVLDISLRPFSTDFATAATSTARPFLHEGRGPSRWGVALERAKIALLRTVPATRYRDLLQYRALGRAPSEWLEEGVRGWVRGQPDADEQLLEQEILPKLKAARRYNSVAVTPEHPQTQYLKSLLALLGSLERTRTLLFYLPEELDALGDQVDRQHHAEQLQRLFMLIRSSLPPSGPVRFLVLRPADFQGHHDDYVHLDAAGNGLLARQLLDGAADALEDHAQD